MIEITAFHKTYNKKVLQRFDFFIGFRFYFNYFCLFFIKMVCFVFQYCNRIGRAMAVRLGCYVMLCYAFIVAKILIFIAVKLVIGDSP
jgi:hypothetical protein